MAASPMSVPKIWIGMPPFFSFSRNSARVIETEYASSPVEHPGTHTRIGSFSPRFSRSAGRTWVARASYDSGSRKKRVT